MDRNVERASKLDTATLSDALDKLRLVAQCYKLGPVSHEMRMTGRAYTVLYGPAGNPAGTRFNRRLLRSSCRPATRSV